MTSVSVADADGRDAYALDPDQQGVLALAQAVSEQSGRAGVLDPDNRVTEWVRIERAVHRGVTFVVRLASHIVGCDFDLPEELRCLPAVRSFLTSRALAFVEVESGRVGHRHLFIVTTPTKREALMAEIAEIAGAGVPRRDLRPPLSPHRHGLMVSLVSPATVEEALTLLRVGVGSGRLTERTFRRLRQGDATGRYPSDSEVEMAVMTGMADRGWHSERVYKALSNPRNQGGAKTQRLAQERGERFARAYVSSSYAKACEFVARRPAFGDRQEVIAALCSQRMRVEDALWSGSAGQKKQQVMLALIDMAVEYGSVYVHPGLRHLSEVVGLAENTVNNVLKVLVKDRWLRKHPAAKGKQTTYKVNTNKRPTKWSNLEALPTSPYGGCERSASELDPNHDAFQHGAGLGLAGHTLLTHLVEPLSMSEMVTRTGLPKSTVLRLLKVLKQARLVEQTNSAYQAATGLRRTLLLGVHARDREVLMAGQARRAGNQRDRQRRHDSLPPEEQAKRPQAGPQAPTGGRGLLNPTSGTFTRLTGPVKASDDLGQGQVGPLALSVRYHGCLISVQDGREVLWATTEGEASRAYRHSPVLALGQTAPDPARG